MYVFDRITVDCEKPRYCKDKAGRRSMVKITSSTWYATEMIDRQDQNAVMMESRFAYSIPDCSEYFLDSQGQNARTTEPPRKIVSWEGLAVTTSDSAQSTGRIWTHSLAHSLDFWKRRKYRPSYSWLVSRESLQTTSTLTDSKFCWTGHLAVTRSLIRHLVCSELHRMTYLQWINSWGRSKSIPIIFSFR
jgi:hypothetical protein